MPDAHGAVLGAGDEDGEARVEEHGGDVVGVTLQHLHARLGLVVPDPHLVAGGEGGGDCGLSGFGLMYEWMGMSDLHT